MKSIKRVAVMTIPVAAAIAASVSPASAAVGDYSTKTYIAWDYQVTDKGTNASQCDLNGKAPVSAENQKGAQTPPEEIGGYCKSNDGKIGYTRDVVKDTNKYYGEVNLGKDSSDKPTGSAIGGSVTTNNAGTVTADELYYKTDYNQVTPGTSSPQDQQFQVGVKQTNVDTTAQTTVYTQDQNRAGDQLGVSYNTSTGDVSVYTKYVGTTDQIGTKGTAGSATLTPTTESSYVVANTKTGV